MKKKEIETFGQLGIGSVAYFNVPKNGIFEYFVVLRKYQHKNGVCSMEVLNLETFTKQYISQSHEIEPLWTIVKCYK